MTNEIKRILEELKEDVEENILVEVRGIYFKPLLDYITNLQERIDKAKKEIEYFELKANHLDDEIYLDEELSNKLLDILRGKDNE